MDIAGNLEWYRTYATHALNKNLENRLVSDITKTQNGYGILGYTGMSMFTAEDRLYVISTDINGCYSRDPLITGIDYFCTGDSTMLHVAPDFDSYTWSNGAASESAFVSIAGDYSLTVIDTNDCPLWSDTLSITEQPLPQVRILTDGALTICDGDSVRLTADVENYDPQKEYSFRWPNNSATDEELHVGWPGIYSIRVEDNFGCTDYDSVEVMVRYPYEQEKICIVTVDMFTGKNLIVWEKTPDEGIDHYNVYRENVLIGEVAGNDLSIFRDSVADPKKRPYLYQLSVVDTCGNESELSPYHKPIFLQYTGSTGGVNLEWDKYEIEGETVDFESYTIYRGSDSTALLPLEENIPVVIPVYTDNDPGALDQKYFYRIAGALSTPCYPSAGKKADDPILSAMSNHDDNKITELHESIMDTYPGRGMFIYPNPATDRVTVELPNGRSADFQLQITDLTGKVVTELDHIKGSKIELNLGSLTGGLYFVELKGSGIHKQKLIIE